MTTNILPAGWSNFDSGELRYILFERIGRPGQYDGPDTDQFYLPLAREACQLKLLFSGGKQLVAIEPGPAFDADKWAQVVLDVECTCRRKFGRDVSFSSYRVSGSWRGISSGVQILPPPEDAPRPPVETAEHPFILEFPLIASDHWSVTNYRRRREHRKLTFLLNILLLGRTTHATSRPRHFWALVPGKATDVQWVQQFYFGDIGEVVRDELAPPDTELLEEIDPEIYYTMVGHDGRSLRVPADLDDSICLYAERCKVKTYRDKFDIAAFWMDMASRQWEQSLSASFTSLVIACEALGERTSKPETRFKDFLERYTPGSSFESRRQEMYRLRNAIIHGSDLMEMDHDADHSWGPPERSQEDLLSELWGLTRIAVRNWIKSS
jgi:hypothetical protein